MSFFVAWKFERAEGQTEILVRTYHIAKKEHGTAKSVRLPTHSVRPKHCFVQRLRDSRSAVIRND